WADSHGSAPLVKGCVREPRKLLGDDPAAPRYIASARAASLAPASSERGALPRTPIAWTRAPGSVKDHSSWSE
ncbi:MAG: hypothetical protein ACREQY_16935, partial [Candidatus Binatia bacterium]